MKVRGLDIEGANREPLLQGITLEVRAGEILAVMATTGKYFFILTACIKIFNQASNHILHLFRASQCTDFQLVIEMVNIDYSFVIVYIHVIMKIHELHVNIL